MELNFVRDFLELAERKYYAEVAEALFISPSSLTRHIQALEKDLGRPLFIRTSREVKLTEFGKDFLSYAKRLHDTYEEFLLKYHFQLRREKKIIIGYISGLGLWNVASGFDSFKKDNQDVELEFLPIQKNRQFELLGDNVFDFLITWEDYIQEDIYNNMPIIEDRLVLVVPSSHHLADRDEITLKELTNEKLTIVDTLAGRNGSFLRECREGGLYPGFNVADSGNIMDRVIIGKEAVVMTKRPAVFFSDKNVCVMDITPKMLIRIMLIWRKNPPLTEIEKLFLGYFEEIPR